VFVLIAPVVFPRFPRGQFQRTSVGSVHVLFWSSTFWALRRNAALVATAHDPTVRPQQLQMLFLEVMRAYQGRVIAWFRIWDGCWSC
jgi:hypothetical protein